LNAICSGERYQFDELASAEMADSLQKHHKLACGAFQGG
jgi:hypothetical protein